MLRNGVGIEDLKTLDAEDALTLLEIIMEEREDTVANLQKLLKSKKGSGIQTVVDISQAGKPY